MITPKKIYLSFQFMLTYLHHFVVFTSERPFLGRVEYGWKHTASWYLLLVAILWYLSDKIYLGSRFFLCKADSSCDFSSWSPVEWYELSKIYIFWDTVKCFSFHHHWDFLSIMNSHDHCFLSICLDSKCFGNTVQLSQHCFQFHSQLHEQDITNKQFDDPLLFIFRP